VKHKEIEGGLALRKKLFLAGLLISLPSLSGLASAAEETLKITYLSRIQEAVSR
jgi:hypothetical protein